MTSIDRNGITWASTAVLATAIDLALMGIGGALGAMDGCAGSRSSLELTARGILCERGGNGQGHNEMATATKIVMRLIIYRFLLPILPVLTGLYSGSLGHLPECYVSWKLLLSPFPRSKSKQPAYTCSCCEGCSRLRYWLCPSLERPS